MMTLLLPGGSLRRVLAEDDDRLGSRRRSLGGSRVVAAGIFTLAFVAIFFDKINS